MNTLNAPVGPAPTRLVPSPKRLALLALAVALGSGLVTFALAASDEGEPTVVHEVRMVNVADHGRFVYDPPLLFIEPGERVRFVPADPGHGSQTIPGMVPDGGPTWRTAINREIEVVFDVEGVYGFRCRAHYTVGMIGLIVVGDPSSNLERARAVAHPERPQAVVDEFFERIEAEARSAVDGSG